ncbi:poly [ADP-ribose] polymerase-like [Papilio machaon]|uniref:poly [ADP-ribose] polymerase-like n=1 Tax=Papilio machaon TaxID=76193 RepID=UPI001E6659D1|nr:poly [ADP-ribose] polymerase-like [Papilio machaon]
MSSSLYEVEYAKSDKSECKICKLKIDKGYVRFAINLQSAFCDKMQSHWHHEECFFKKIFLHNVSEIGKFNLLLHNDQERIKAKIKKVPHAALPLSDENKVSKRSFCSSNTDILSTFSIEYAKTSSATCRYCDIKIIKNEIRISKSKYDPRYGDCLMWYHQKCFVDKREDLMFFATGKDIPGFENLRSEDQTMLMEKISDVDDDFISKKLKTCSNNGSDAEVNEELQDKLTEQSKVFDAYRNDLKDLTKNEIHALLKENNLDLPSTREQCIDGLADCMAFGVPKKCPECNQGQLILDNFYYRCTGDVTAWTQCYYTTKEPEKDIFKVPESLRSHKIFQNYKSNVIQRLFWSMPLTTAKVLDTSASTNPQREISYPLKNIQFFLYGKLKAPKEDLKLNILKLGGLVVNKLTDTTAAVVTTKEELDKNSTMIQTIQNKDIEVIDESYFDFIDAENGTVLDSLRLIQEKNIASWGCDLFKRIPKNVLDGKVEPKSGNMYKSSSKHVETKSVIKDGHPIDIKSGLQNIAHVYKDSEKAYSEVLCKFSVENNKNSYYKLQLLEADDENKYWVYRSWGRTGTTIGGHQSDPFTSIEAAKEHFLKIYTEKTGDDWISEEFSKKARAYVPIDISYGDIKQSTIQFDSEVNLPKSVQFLITKIFDTEIMNKTLLEFKLDLDIMPLGKLSKSQIKLGYSVLADLLQMFDNNLADEKKIKDASNRFYTLIPHSFGTDGIKLLDSPDYIKQKIELLDSLLDIEIAYKLLQSPTDGSLTPIESHYLKLKTDIRPLDKTTPQFELISTYMKNTHAPTHLNYTLEIEELFEVIREGEAERYEKFKQLDNKRLLWHGSRITNLAGILSQGLRIAPPEAPVTGYMFGKGIYFADMSSKSANYCFANKSNDTGFVLLCEVALGEMKKCYAAQNIKKLAEGTHSVWGVGRTQPDPSQNKIIDDGVIVPLGTHITTQVASSLLYNEFIVYDVNQVNVKYLVQLKFHFN